MRLSDTLACATSACKRTAVSRFEYTDVILTHPSVCCSCCYNLAHAHSIAAELLQGMMPVTLLRVRSLALVGLGPFESTLDAQAALRAIGLTQLKSLSPTR